MGLSISTQYAQHVKPHAWRFHNACICDVGWAAVAALGSTLHIPDSTSHVWTF